MNKAGRFGFAPRGVALAKLLSLCAALFCSCVAGQPAMASHVTVYVQPYSVDLKKLRSI